MPRMSSSNIRNKIGKRQRKRAARRHAQSDQRKHKRVARLKAASCLLLVALCAFLAVMVGNADYKATPFGWIPLITVLLGIAAAFGYLQVLKRSLVFEETSSLADCQRDKDIDFTVAFKNTSPLFFFRVEVFFYISDLYGNVASRAMTTLSLAPFEEYELSFSAKFEHIGTYSAGLEKVRVVDFLNLFSTTIENDRKQTVQVTPKFQLIDGLRFSPDAMQETTKAAKTILADSMDYAYVREYVPGDPLKTIHWKLSSRNADGRYMTRLYEMPTNPAVGVIMDFYGNSQEAGVLMGFFDAVVESGFSIASYARYQGMDVKVRFVDRDGTKAELNAWNEDTMPQIIQSMPPMSNKVADQALAMDLLRDQMVSQRGENNLIVCTANLSAEMISLICESKTRHREPMLVAVIPTTLVGKERDDYTASLARLDAADIGYLVISRSDELLGAIG